MLPDMARQPDDTTLMLRYRDGDVAAFEILYGRHKDALFRYFLRQCGDRDTAAELFQELWLRLVRNRTRYTASAKFTTYVYTLAHSCFIDYWRRCKRKPLQLESDGDCPLDEHADPGARAVEDQVAGLEAHARLATALEVLPPEQREAFLLREEGGLSLEEIAAATGVGRETAKSRLRYAVGRLRSALAEEVKT